MSQVRHTIDLTVDDSRTYRFCVYASEVTLAGMGSHPWCNVDGSTTIRKAAYHATAQEIASAVRELWERSSYEAPHTVEPVCISLGA